MASVMDQIRKLDEQKATLLNTAKQEALEAAQKAIETLNELGFSYRLVEGAGAPTATRAPRAASTGTRRTGIRDQILDMLKQEGMSRSELLIRLDAKGDKSAEQSISNALAALKKAGTIDAKDGTYSVA